MIFEKAQYTYLFIFTIVFIWCLMIILAPFLAYRGYSIAGFLYLFFSKICHQNPARSFHLWNHQFAVCSRCMGIYLGFLFGTIIMPLLKNKRIPTYVIFIALLLVINVIFGFVGGLLGVAILGKKK